MPRNNLTNFKVRGVYGKPLSKLAGGIPIDQKALEECGKVIAKAIQAEARKDAAMRVLHGRGQPVAMTPAHKVAETIKCRVVGRSTLELYSDHPFIKQFTEGVPSFPMTWLTRQKGVGAVPLITHTGEVVFRMAPNIGGHPAESGKGQPSPLGGYWIHPGFRKYNFFERGIKKGREAVMASLYERVVYQALAKSDLLL